MKFCFAGRFTDQKNIFFMLDSLEKLAHTVSDDFEIHMAGGGPLEKDLMAHAKGLAVGDRIVWHGWCDKTSLIRLYRESGCFISLSVYEGMPNTVLEAMACGAAIIVTDLPSATEWISDGVNGEVIEPRDVNALADRIIRLAGDAGRRREYGARCVEIVRKKADHAANMEKMEEIYLRLHRGRSE